MLIGFRRGQGSIVLRVKILNSSVATGAGLTGLTSASSGLIVSTIADNEASATTYTVAGSTIESITTLGTYAAPTATKCRFKEVDATNHKGVYEIQIADARFAVSSAKSLLVSISGATNAAETDVVIPLRDLDPYDAAAGGLSRLDAAVSSRLASASYTAPDNATITAIAGYVDTEVAAIKAKTDNLPASFPSNFSSLGITAGGAVTVNGASALTEGYSIKGAAFTLEQALYETVQFLDERSVASTTVTVKKRDRSTTAKTLTLDSSTAPTSTTRAT